MTIFDIFIIAVGLSMDAFAVAICKGLTLKKAEIKYMLSAGVWFGGFQGLMPCAGYVVGIAFTGIISRYSGIIACILLCLIGIGMIREALKDSDENADNASANSFSCRAMLSAAVATSIDALSVGVSFAAYKVNIILTAVIICVTTFFFSAAGVIIGSVFGNRYEKKAQITGGIILIVMGIRFILIK